MIPENEVKPISIKDIIKSLLIIILIVVVIITIFEYLADKETKRKILKYDYLLEVTQDSMYIFNNKDTIYIEKIDWDNPTPLQKAIEKNNL